MSNPSPQPSVFPGESHDDRPNTDEEGSCPDVVGFARPDPVAVQVGTKILPTESRCKICSGPLPADDHRRSYCSPACRDIGRQGCRYPKIDRACEHCGAAFQARLDNVKRGMGRFCSRACNAANVVQTGRQMGAANGNWKGGVSNDNMRYRRRQKERHPVEEVARQSVRNAVKRGELVKLPCEHCGAAKSNGHHPDYSKPLDVIWLCRPCHDSEHARLKIIGATP